MPLPALIALLELLVAEVPEPDLQAELDALRAQGAVDGLGFERLSRILLTLHQSRAADRRRAAGLTALGDTAMDLAARRDLDELLSAICRRVRMLLGTDVAYITLTDGHHTFVRATDGIVSKAFREMRIRLGAGLGGLVARTGEPAYTPDYESDSRLIHLPEVDRRVASERLRAIVAVPLRRGDEIRGVVMSGSRTVRQFDPQEVSLLASLAAHASIAIENAELLQSSANALDALAATNDRMRSQTERTQRVAVALERLASAAVGGAGPEELLQALTGVLPGRAELVDNSGEMVAVAGTAQPGDQATVWEQPILAGAEELATLHLQRVEAEGVEAEVLALAAPLLASLLLARQTQTEREYRHRSRLLEDVLEAREDADQHTQRLLARAGVRSDDDYVVLVAALPESARRWGWLRASQLVAADGRGLVGTVGASLVIIVPGNEADVVAHRWAERLRSHDGTPATIGVAPRRRNQNPLRSAHREATGALNLLLALGHRGSCATVDQLGIFGHMFVHQSETDLRAFIRETLGGLITAHDTDATTLLQTLEEYFEQSGHLARTARALGIHINTMYGRMTKLTTLLGPDWQEADRRLGLHLAVRLNAIDRAQAGHRDEAD
jgi:GAF domain-containing protein